MTTIYYCNIELFDNYSIRTGQYVAEVRHDVGAHKPRAAVSEWHGA